MLFGGDSQAASLMSFCSFHWVAFAIALDLHCASEHGQHFATLSNMLGQLYPRPSGARLLSPLNLSNYASHQLFSLSMAVIPEPHTRTASFPTSFFISEHLPLCLSWVLALISFSHYLPFPLSFLSPPFLLRHPPVLISLILS